MAATNAFEVRDLSFGYNGGLSLKNLTFSVSSSELTAIIGPNGSGKTTLLKILLGLLTPIAGAVTLAGQPLSAYGARERAKMIAYVPQQPALSFPLTVRQLVALGRYPHGGRGRESAADKRAIDEALERTTSTGLSNRPFNTLSGGEKQKVLIARALAQSAKALLLDEPTLHLDLHYQLEILAELRRLCLDQGITVMTVLHDINLAALFADHALLLKDGVLRGFGPVSEVINEASIKALLDVDTRAIGDDEQQTRYFVPRHPLSR